MQQDILLTIAGTILTWLASEKFLIPWIVTGWNWMINKGRELDDKNINSTKELKEIEDKISSNYESQIKFLVESVERLEHELLEYQKTLEELRSKILELNQRLYQKSLTITKLRQISCTNAECPNRAFCTDDLK